MIMAQDNRPSPLGGSIILSIAFEECCQKGPTAYREKDKTNRVYWIFDAKASMFGKRLGDASHPERNCASQQHHCRSQKRHIIIPLHLPFGEAFPV